MNKLKSARRLFSEILLVLSVLTAGVSAATLTVDNTTDDSTLRACTAAANDCSLRGAIVAAVSGDTINFASPLFDSPQTITLAVTFLTINKSLTIRGRGARQLTVKREASNPRPFMIFFIPDGTSTITLSGMTITGGNDSGITNNGDSVVNLDGMNISGNSAGGVANFGTMTIVDSLISSNTDAVNGGGGVFNNGTMTIANTTIVNNTVATASLGGSAGGIRSASILNLNNVTIAGNTNNSSNMNSAGGVSSFNQANVRNTIISSNSVARGTSDDVRGTFVSNGNNLVHTTDGSSGFTQPTDITGMLAQFSNLQNNGGQTDTLAPLANSLAVNAGSNCVVNQSCSTNNPPVALTSDQRQSPYVRRNNTVDIGALELQTAPPTAAGTTAGGRVTESNGRGIFRVLVTMTGASGNQRTVYTNQQGYYNFEDVAAGQVYIFTAQHRRYSFEQPTQARFIGEETNQINFTGTASGIVRFDIWNLPTKRIE